MREEEQELCKVSQSGSDSLDMMTCAPSGQHSTQERKTYPKIQIVGTTRPAVVVVSCVTHDTDTPKAHPHNLVSPASVRQSNSWPSF